MDEFLTYFIVFLLGFIGYIYYDNISKDVGYVKSNVDHRKYLVRNLPDRDNAANLLARIYRKEENWKLTCIATD